MKGLSDRNAPGVTMAAAVVFVNSTMSAEEACEVAVAMHECVRAGGDPEWPDS